MTRALRQALRAERERSNKNAKRARQWQAEAELWKGRCADPGKWEEALKECLASRNKLQGEVERLEAENAQLEGTIQRQQAGVEDLKEKNQQLQGTIDRQQGAIESQQEQIRDLQQELEDCPEEAPPTLTVRNSSSQESVVEWVRGDATESATLGPGQTLTLEVAPSSTDISDPQ